MKEINYKDVFLLLIALLVFIIVPYLTIAFIYLKISFLDWSIENRICYILMVLGLFVFTCYIVATIDEIKDNKPKLPYE